MGVSVFFFSSRRRHTRFKCDWSSDVCSSDLNREIGQPAQNAIEQREQASAQSFFGAARTLGDNHLGSVLPGLYNPRQDFRRILKIAVHKNNGIALPGLQPSRECRLMPILTRELPHP